MKSGQRALIAVALLACTPLAVSEPADLGAVAPVPSPSEASELRVDVMSSAYGSVEVRTAPEVQCTLRVEVHPGDYGDGPPALLGGRSRADGSLVWTYPAPLVPAGTGHHRLRCTDRERLVEVERSFTVPERALDPRGFTVRIHAVQSPAEIPDVEAVPDPGLAPARDAAVAQLHASLEGEWTAATRGSGALRIVGASADVPIHVIAGRGYAENHIAPDGTHRIVIPVADEHGRPRPVIPSALHELGHLWCCFGPDADGEGHWREERVDPQLGGVNRFGVMNAVAHCARFEHTEQRCPDRFSERELREMGFRDIPAPPPHPCVVGRRALEDEVDSLDAALDVREVRIEALRDELRRLLPSPTPTTRLVLPGAPGRTAAPAGRADELRRAIAALVEEHLAQLEVRNVAASRLKALPPC